MRPHGESSSFDRPAARRRRSARRVLAGLCVAAGFVLLGPAHSVLAHEFTYDTSTRGDVEGSLELFKQIASEALTDIRGWSLHLNVEFTRVGSDGDFHLILASPEEVDAASPVCSPMWSCRVGDDVLINDDRWRKGAAAWTESLREYRRYVINHEVGHWLGLDHVDCPGPGRGAPVMMQQSKGLDGCEARVWPKFWERDAVADIHNVDG